MDKQKRVGENTLQKLQRLQNKLQTELGLVDEYIDVVSESSGTLTINLIDLDGEEVKLFSGSSEEVLAFLEGSWKYRLLSIVK